MKPLSADIERREAGDVPPPHDGAALVHRVDLDIVKAVTALCDRHGLKYFMLGGTMLGAIRHKGFIPWDDDVDLGLFRPDYERFLELSGELPPHLRTVDFRDTDHPYYLTRILDTTTQVVEERLAGEKRMTHASIDLFPIDGTPDNPLLRRLHYLRFFCHRTLLALCHKESLDRKRPRGFAERLVLRFLEALPVSKWTTPQRQKRRIDALLRRHPPEKAKVIGNFMGAYRTREFVPAEQFGAGRMYPFEDILLRGVDMPHEYLSQIYGDYMSLPPPGDRRTHFRLVELRGKKLEG